MKINKVAVPFGNVPLGTRVWLTDGQAGARRHLITPVGDKGTRRTSDGAEEVRSLFVANAQLGFKAGEEIGVEGDLDRGLELLFGLEGKPAAQRRKATTPVETPKTKAARTKSSDAAAKRKSEARAKRVASAEQALKAAQAEAADAQGELQSAADGDRMGAAQSRLAAAQAAVEAAGKKLAKARAS